MFVYLFLSSFKDIFMYASVWSFVGVLVLLKDALKPFLQYIREDCRSRNKYWANKDEETENPICSSLLLYHVNVPLKKKIKKMKRIFKYKKYVVIDPFSFLSFCLVLGLSLIAFAKLRSSVICICSVVQLASDSLVEAI